MVSFSRARFGEVDPNIAISRDSAPADMTSQRAVQAFGEVAGQIRQGMLAGDLKQELRESGNIISTINAGEDAIQDAVRKGQIDPTTEKFQRLAAASEQGVISQQRAALEAEVLLRQSISMAPGFADQLRKTARDTLGFDPTAGALNTLFMSGPDQSSNRVTQEMKDLEQADALVAGGYTQSREEALSLIVAARAAEFEAKLDAQRIRNGKVSASRITVIGAKRAQSGANEFLLEAFKQVRTEGGVVDAEVLKNGMIAQREKIKAEIEDEMASSEEFIYPDESYKNVRTRIDEVFEASMEMLDNQDILNVLAREQEKLESIVSLTGIALAPELAVMSQFGDAAVSGWIELMAASNGDRRIMNELIKVDPQYKFLDDLDLQNDKLMPALRAAAQGALGQKVLTGEVDEETAKATARKEGLDLINGKVPPEETPRIYTNLTDVGQTVTALSALAETRDSHFHTPPEKRQEVAGNFRVTQELQQKTVAERLAQSGMGLGWDGERFVVQDPQGRSAAQVAPSSGIDNTLRALGGPTPMGRRFDANILAREAGVTEQLNLLNNTMLNLVKDPRWAKEFGYEDANDWANSLMNSVNLEAAGAGLASGLDSEISQALGFAEQAQLRSALESNDIDAAMGILTQAKFAGPRPDSIENRFQSQQEPREAGQGVVDRGTTAGGIQAQVANLDTPVSFENETQAEIARFEGMHTIEDYEATNTIGFGRDLNQNPLTPEDFEVIGLPAGTSDREVAQYLFENPEAAKRLLDKDIEQAQTEARRLLPNFDGMSPIQQRAITNMAFNVGIAGFPKAMEALRNDDIETAIDEIATSCWAQGKSTVTVNGRKQCNTEVDQEGNIRRARVVMAGIAGLSEQDLIAAIRNRG
jgi:GH24 family phage-related lysozyme (muramidase)